VRLAGRGDVAVIGALALELDREPRDLSVDALGGDRLVAVVPGVLVTADEHREEHA
jgi:hypothetical protein